MSNQSFIQSMIVQCCKEVGNYIFKRALALFCGMSIGVGATLGTQQVLSDISPDYQNMTSIRSPGEQANDYSESINR